MKKTTAKKVLLIINPNAGKKRGKTALFSIIDTFCKAGCEVTVRLTEHAGQARDFALESGRFDLTVCCGGDGTLNEVISGAITGKSGTPIGYIPAGTTNDFARTMKIPVTPTAAVKKIMTGSKKAIDIGLMDKTRHFVYIASFGVFTSSSYKTPQAAKNTFGRFAYIMEGMSNLIGSFKTHHVNIKADSLELEGDYIFGAVTNSTSIGGVVNLKPSYVNMNDGLFEIILIKNPKNMDEFAKIINGLATSNFDSNVFEFVKASNIEFSFRDACTWSLDGEEYIAEKNVRIENLHSAVNFII